MRLNKLKNLFLIFILLFLFGCSSTSKVEENVQQNNSDKDNVIKILSLGDSYTIGESVCKNCRFPAQLKDSLQQKNQHLQFTLKVIAKTGWTTKNLLNAINNENLASNFNLVTLLIGVNNQYQRLPFSTFEKEFSILIDKAILVAQSSKDKLIVISIPDYAFTPFGNTNKTISKDIEKYNTYIKNFCKNKNITFLNITDITQDGISNTTLVASDGLHPSTIAYTKFVERLFPIATQELGL